MKHHLRQFCDGKDEAISEGWFHNVPASASQVAGKITKNLPLTHADIVHSSQVHVSRRQNHDVHCKAQRESGPRQIVGPDESLILGALVA